VVKQGPAPVELTTSFTAERVAKMKFFTREWINGEMSEDQADVVPEAYWRYLAALQLPPPIEALSKVNPHDAYILGVEHQHHRSRLTLRLRCGDLQRGYSDVTLTFEQVMVDNATLETLRRAVRPASVEVLYDEVDRASECFVYRLILDPSGEVTILFGHVDLTERPVAHRETA
jgi:hypothetical protein